MSFHVIPSLPGAASVLQFTYWVVVGGFAVLGLIMVYLLLSSPSDAKSGHRLRSGSGNGDGGRPAYPLLSAEADRAKAPRRASDAPRKRRGLAHDDGDGDR